MDIKTNKLCEYDVIFFQKLGEYLLPFWKQTCEAFSSVLLQGKPSTKKKGIPQDVP